MPSGFGFSKKTSCSALLHLPVASLYTIKNCEPRYRMFAMNPILLASKMLGYKSANGSGKPAANAFGKIATNGIKRMAPASFSNQAANAFETAARDAVDWFRRHKMEAGLGFAGASSAGIAAFAAFKNGKNHARRLAKLEQDVQQINAIQQLQLQITERHPPLQCFKEMPQDLLVAYVNALRAHKQHKTALEALPNWCGSGSKGDPALLNNELKRACQELNRSNEKLRTEMGKYSKDGDIAHFWNRRWF